MPLQPRDLEHDLFVKRSREPRPSPPSCLRSGRSPLPVPPPQGELCRQLGKKQEVKARGTLSGREEGAQTRAGGRRAPGISPTPLTCPAELGPSPREQPWDTGGPGLFSLHKNRKGRISRQRQRKEQSTCITGQHTTHAGLQGSSWCPPALCGARCPLASPGSAGWPT